MLPSEGRDLPLVLVVDDDPRNRQLLTCILEDCYRTLEFEDGESVLAEVASHGSPDAILLDVMMPGMSGFEVCQRLKESPVTRTIPILLVTALTDSEDKVRGLDLGADDFITKPVDASELLARVRTHLRIRGLREEVVRSRQELAAEHQKLLELEQMRRDLSDMLVHDLKSPLSALQLNVELLEVTGPPWSDELIASNLSRMSETTRRLLLMVQTLLETARFEETAVRPTLRPLSLSRLLGRLKDERAPSVEGVELKIVLTSGLTCLADEPMIHRVLENLVSNAVNQTTEGGVVELWAEAGPSGGVLLTVADRGPGVPEELREAIFEKFHTRAAGAHTGHGIGLTFVKLAVEAHGGSVWIESRPGGGSLFRFTLPSHAADPSGAEAKVGTAVFAG